MPPTQSKQGQQSNATTTGSAVSTFSSSSGRRILAYVSAQLHYSPNLQIQQPIAPF